MHFYDTTHSSKAQRLEINEIMGKPVPFFKRFGKNGSIGSRRMMVEVVSPALEEVMNRRTNVNYANIELRPKGIIIHFAKGLKSYAWLIPFYQLSIFKGHQLRIHGDGQFVEFKTDNQQTAVMKFIARVIEKKSELMNPNSHLP